MWGGDGIVKALGCARKGKGSNMILDMSWSWHHHHDLLRIEQTINRKNKKWKSDDDDLSWVCEILIIMCIEIMGPIQLHFRPIHSSIQK
jgi:hypothetical protein